MHEGRQETIFLLEEMPAPAEEGVAVRQLEVHQLESKLPEGAETKQPSRDQDEQIGSHVAAGGDRIDQGGELMIGAMAGGEKTRSPVGSETQQSEEYSRTNIIFIAGETPEDEETATPRADDPDKAVEQEAAPAGSPSSSQTTEGEGDQDLDEGYQTPTSPRHRIPPALECPMAPRKPRPSAFYHKKRPFGDGRGVRRLVRQRRIYPLGSDRWICPIEQFHL